MTPLARSATIPPSVSPASRAAAIAATIRALAARSAQRTSLASTASASKVGSASTSPMFLVSLRTSIPTARRSAFATAPAATRAALDLLARTATVPELASPQVNVDLRGRQREAGRHTVDERDEDRAVRLAGGEEAH